MQSWTSFQILAASACLHLAAPSPMYADVSFPEVETRATSICTDLNAERTAGCWDELNIPDYIVGWNLTTPTCAASGGDGSNCCEPQEPWTTCFLRLAYGHAGSDCSDINPQNCNLAPVSPDLDPSIAPKAAYVVQNIVTINSVFVLYVDALSSVGNGISGKNSELAKLQQVLGGDTGDGAALNNGNVVKALLAGLPFWGTPPVLAGGPQQINPNVNAVVAQKFLLNLQDTPSIRSELFGARLDANDHMSTAAGTNLASAVSMLESALLLAMSDVPTFTALAAHGIYSASTEFSFPAQAVGLTSAFTTYLVGEALAQAHFSATPASAATTTTKEAFQLGRTCTPLGDVCKDPAGKTHCWSQAFQTQYVINEPKDWALRLPANPLAMIQQLGYEASAYGLLELIEASSDVYMPVLFDGAYNCTLEGKAGGSSVVFNEDGSLDVACLSNLPIYLAKGSECPAGAVEVGGKCPFGFLG